MPIQVIPQCDDTRGMRTYYVLVVSPISRQMLTYSFETLKDAKAHASSYDDTGCHAEVKMIEMKQ